MKPDDEPGSPAPPGAVPASRATVWRQRIYLVIFVAFCVELGLLLAVLPWTRAWTENRLLAGHLGLRLVLNADFVRGVVSGLGLVDVWIGIREALHYHDPVWQVRR